MVVVPGCEGTGVAAVTTSDGLTSVRRGYEGAAAAWADGAELVYGPMADALLARAPDLAGQLVLDVGTGTGAVSHRLLAAGAHAVAVDASWPMLAHQASSRPPAVVGDISRLPLVDDAVDAGVALAWVAMRDEFTIAIAGPTSPANTTANAAAGDLDLEPDRIKALDALDPPAHPGPV